ncbi:hypothetical protein BG011_000048 [Mortierella polycephala]|uniref:Uncharacterized protein n=1 Tax=Mortierella polycephala TaxID=41804 RepID=A0A9P6QFS9_9FUNG|nr:hypothetical protein BG011_000048 [Mortierella polycephala]
MATATAPATPTPTTPKCEHSRRLSNKDPIAVSSTTSSLEYNDNDATTATTGRGQENESGFSTQQTPSSGKSRYRLQDMQVFPPHSPLSSKASPVNCARDSSVNNVVSRSKLAPEYSREDALDKDGDESDINVEDVDDLDEADKMNKSHGHMFVKSPFLVTQKTEDSDNERNASIMREIPSVQSLKEEGLHVRTPSRSRTGGRILDLFARAGLARSGAAERDDEVERYAEQEEGTSDQSTEFAVHPPRTPTKKRRTAEDSFYWCESPEPPDSPSARWRYNAVMNPTVKLPVPTQPENECSPTISSPSSEGFSEGGFRTPKRKHRTGLLPELSLEIQVDITSESTTEDNEDNEENEEEQGIDQLLALTPESMVRTPTTPSRRRSLLAGNNFFTPPRKNPPPAPRGFGSSQGVIFSSFYVPRNLESPLAQKSRRRPPLSPSQLSLREGEQ